MVDIKAIMENIKTVESEHGLSRYESLQRFMFERILERISLSKYKDNFILKGGLFISAVFGIDNRTTRDMDALIDGIDISSSELISISNSILSMDINDGVEFKILGLEDIRENNEYGGKRMSLIGHFNNLKVNLEIDISTGDIITPKQIEYTY